MACLSVGRVNWRIFTGLFFNTRSRVKAMMPCASGCANWRMNDAGSAIVVWASCWLKPPAFDLSHQIKAGGAQRSNLALHSAKSCDSGFCPNALERVLRRTTRSCSVSIVRKGWRCVADAHASAPWARAGLFSFRIAPISDGPWTSCPMPLKMVSGSVCHASWMIARARRWQPSWTAHYLVPA